MAGFFVPALCGTGAYLLPSHDLLKLVIGPSLVAILIVVGAFIAARQLIGRWYSGLVSLCCSIVVISLLVELSLSIILSAAGVDWQVHVPRGHVDLQAALREFKVGLLLVLLALVWATRSAIPNWYRGLGSLGFAFLALATVRLFILSSAVADVTMASTGTNAVLRVPAHVLAKSDLSSDPAARIRRVVWVIFDETDFERVFHPKGNSEEMFPNFNDLARKSILAANANSPASATFYSIPSLLTGLPLAGRGVDVDGRGILWIESLHGEQVAFSESASIFGALARRGLTASVLGFYHPYCKLFLLEDCESFSWPTRYGVVDAITANLPLSWSKWFERIAPWGQITEDSLSSLPSYLNRDDALTFVHLNFPHLPATFADEQQHLVPNADPLVEYSRNLKMADNVLGTIVKAVEERGGTYDQLLVVSTDHWLRNMWYRANVPESSQRIPLIVWKVGERNGQIISEPVSTVHTSQMVLDFIDGRLGTQEEIAGWWRSKPVYPTFIVGSN